MLVFTRIAGLAPYLSRSTAFMHTSRIMSSKFADPTYDVTFKMLFATPQNKGLTIHFLNSLLFPNKPSITDLEWLNVDLGVSHVGNLESAIDVRCRLENGKEVMIEMQRQPTIYFLPRTQYYMARALAGKLKDGDGARHHLLEEVHMLSICRLPVFTHREPILDRNGTAIKFDKFETTVYPVMEEYDIMFPRNKMFWKFFELAKFPGSMESNSKEFVQSPKYQWLQFLKTCSESKEIPNNIDDNIKRAYEIMEQHGWPAEKKEAYDFAIASTDELDIETIEEFAEQKGLERGLERGLQQGRVESEKIKTIEIARKLLIKGRSIIETMDVTGLSEEEVSELYTGLNKSSAHKGFTGKRDYHTYAALSSNPDDSGNESEFGEPASTQIELSGTGIDTEGY